MQSESWLRAINKQRAKLDARVLKKDDRTPVWAKDPQGMRMFWVMVSDMLARVSQASDPDWFGPAEPTIEAEDEVVKMAYAMEAVDSYADASMAAMKMLARWPVYQYLPHKPAAEDC